MRVVSLTGASEVAHSESGQQYAAGPDGVFDLPEELGAYLADRHASQWRRETDHHAMATAAKVEELRNPHVVPHVLAKVLDRMDALEARVAELESAASAAGTEQASAEDIEDSSGGEELDEGEPDVTEEPDEADEAEAEPEAEPEEKPAKKPAASKRAAPKRQA